MFLALEITDHPGTVNYVHPEVSKPTKDVCNLWIFSYAVHDFWRRKEEKTSDLGMFLVGKVYHLAAYATALTHLLQPICCAASCSRCGGTQPAAAPRQHGAELGCGYILPLITWGWPGRKKIMHHRGRGCKVSLEAACTHERQGRLRSHLGMTRPLQRWITTSLSGGCILKHHP